MSKQHGKDTVVKLNGVDLSIYGSKVEFSRKADSHDLTTFGNDSHRKGGGLLDGSAVIEGWWEGAAVTGGPAPVINPLIGTVVPMVYQPEGTGSGKAQRTVDVLIVSYVESSPVADYVSWTCDVEFDGDVTTTNQGP